MLCLGDEGYDLVGPDSGEGNGIWNTEELENENWSNFLPTNDVWDEGEQAVVGTLREVAQVSRPTTVVLDGSWAMRSRWDDVLALLKQSTNELINYLS